MDHHVFGNDNVGTYSVRWTLRVTGQLLDYDCSINRPKLEDTKVPFFKPQQRNLRFRKIIRSVELQYDIISVAAFEIWWNLPKMNVASNRETMFYWLETEGSG